MTTFDDSMAEGELATATVKWGGYRFHLVGVEASPEFPEHDVGRLEIYGLVKRAERTHRGDIDG